MTRKLLLTSPKMQYLIAISLVGEVDSDHSLRPTMFNLSSAAGKYYSVWIGRVNLLFASGGRVHRLLNHSA